MRFSGLGVEMARPVGRAALATVAFVMLGGCGAMAAAEAAFNADFSCNEGTAEETEARGRYRVHGCNREATYQCVGSGDAVCGIQAVDTSADASSTRALSRAAPRGPVISSEVQVQDTGDAALMVLELVLDGKALLRLTAEPEKHADLVQFKVVRRELDEESDECNLEFMVNGQVLATPKAVAVRDGRVLSHRVQLGHGLIGEFAGAQKIAMRACRERWALTREQVQKVRDFMDRFQEEMAWKSPPRDGSTGGMLAPSGGWPVWSTEKKAPPAVDGAPLDARALFKKLSPSVFQLEATRSDGVSQGSAVAISTTELLTNCHVVQGASKLVLRQGQQHWQATVLRADPATDRCVITLSDISLQPVVGVRSYDSLEVGEPAFTLGSPVGLELTLSTGIVSGRREEKERRYVQTTAPISPGSSGGGLFDAHGNLIGITTLVLVGRERLNQSLNFAVPAESFWLP